jgi:hypothetical protein
MSNAHVKHEAKRLASEVLTVKGRELTARGGVLPRGVSAPPGLRAVGSMAYASIYSSVTEEREPPDFYVERRLTRSVRGDDGARHEWITCSERFKTIERARNFVSCNPSVYRLVVRTAGGYVPDSPKPKGKGAQGFW